MPALDRGTQGDVFVQDLGFGGSQCRRLDEPGVAKPEFLTETEDVTRCRVQPGPAVVEGIVVADRAVDYRVQCRLFLDEGADAVAVGTGQIIVGQRRIRRQATAFADRKGQAGRDAEILGVVVGVLVVGRPIAQVDPCAQVTAQKVLR